MPPLVIVLRAFARDLATYALAFLLGAAAGLIAVLATIAVAIWLG